mgnify:FL=1
MEFFANLESLQSNCQSLFRELFPENLFYVSLRETKVQEWLKKM